MVFIVQRDLYSTSEWDFIFRSLPTEQYIYLACIYIDTTAAGLYISGSLYHACHRGSLILNIR